MTLDICLQHILLGAGAPLLPEHKPDTSLDLQGYCWHSRTIPAEQTVHLGFFLLKRRECIPCAHAGFPWLTARRQRSRWGACLPKVGTSRACPAGQLRTDGPLWGHKSTRYWVFSYCPWSCDPFSHVDEMELFAFPLFAITPQEERWKLMSQAPNWRGQQKDKMNGGR